MSIIIDFIMVGLLVGVILHARRLCSAVEKFKRLHAEIPASLRDYAQTLHTGSERLQELKQFYGDIHQLLNSKYPDIQMMRSDLELLIDKANQTCDALEHTFRQARDFVAQNRHIPSNQTADVPSLLPDSALQPQESEVVQAAEPPVASPSTPAAKRGKRKARMRQEILLSPDVTLEPFLSDTISRKKGRPGHVA